MLKQILKALMLSSSATLFTSGKISINSNILMEPAVTEILAYIKQEEWRTFHHYDSNALILVLEVVFWNNIIQFMIMTGIGILLAPPWATIIYVLHVNSFLPEWSENVLFYCHFINDVFHILACDKCPTMNDKLQTASKLQMRIVMVLNGSFHPLSRRFNFMDLTLTISQGSISSTLFEKEQTPDITFCHILHT